MNGLKKYTDGKEMINRREANKCRVEGAERAIEEFNERQNDWEIRDTGTTGVRQTPSPHQAYFISPNTILFLGSAISSRHLYM